MRRSRYDSVAATEPVVPTLAKEYPLFGLTPRPAAEGLNHGAHPINQPSPVNPQDATRALERHLSEAVLAVNRQGAITAVLGSTPGVVSPAWVGSHVFDHCHPEDLAHMERFAAEALATAPGWEGSSFARVSDQDGAWHYYELHVVNQLDDPAVRGYAVRLRELRRSPDGVATPKPAGLRHELETLAGAIPLPIMFLDKAGAPYFMNHAARDLFAGLADRLETEGFVAVADPREHGLLEETLRSLYLDGGERTLTFRLLNQRAGAAERIVEATFSAQGGGAQTFTIVVTLVDITAHRARELELRRMASCDPLTGLLNRAEIEDALAGRLRAAPERVALLYCDLDGFKLVNDNHGHDVGDELLVEIAQILQAKTRPDDLVGRLGGDEFAVLIDSSDPSDAHGLACRIAVAIAELSSYRRLPVTASVGAATARVGDTTRDLLRRADAAMYDEKRRRHERVGRSSG